MTRLEWEKAAKRDIVKERGRLPWWVGLSGEHAPSTPPDPARDFVDAESTRGLEILVAYLRLPRAERIRREREFMGRLAGAYREDEDRLTPIGPLGTPLAVREHRLRMEGAVFGAYVDALREEYEQDTA